MFNTTLNHIALEYKNKEEADIFFIEILGMKQIRTFSLSEDLSGKIFRIKNKVDVYVYGNDERIFEVFITGKTKESSFEHICLDVKSKTDLIKKCKQFNLEIIRFEKDKKEYLFIKDFSDNLYEIKEK